MSVTAPATPSPELSALLARILAEDGALPDATTLAPEAGRAQAARVHRRWRANMPSGVRVTEFSAPDATGAPMRCRRIDPEGAVNEGAIVFLHGGGWAFCDIDSHEDVMRRLAIAARLPVLACDYRLAPEHRFPAGLEDCRSFWRGVQGGSFPEAPSRGPIFIAGDSAGANLALALMLAEQVEDAPLPDAALLVYGVYDDDFETPSYREHAEAPGLTRDRMRRFWEWYCDVAERDDWRTAPLRAEDDKLRALPPLMLVASEIDPLRDDTLRLKARLDALGRHDPLHLLPGMTHGAIQMGGWLPAMAATVAELGVALTHLANQT